jgi:signal transduction histidine kinase
VLAVLYGSHTLALAFVWRVHRNVKGPSYWIAGMGMLCLGGSLLLFSKSLSPVIAIVIANSLLVAGVALLLRGIRAFQGIERGGAWEWGAVVLVFAAFVYFTYVQYDLNARIAVISAVFAALLFRCAAAILIDMPAGRRGVHLVVVGGAATVAAVFVVRAGLILLDIGTTAPDTMFLTAATIANKILVLVVPGYILMALGLAILPGQKVQIDLADEISDRERLECELVHSKKMEAVGQLTSGIAHEFNNLLQVIIGNLQVLRNRLGEGNKDAELIDRATDYAMRGGKMTRQLLSFSRQQILFSEAININDCLVGIVPQLRELLSDGIALETKFAGDVVPVNIDPGIFENEIRNLLLNARSAMPEGGTATIETATVELDMPVPHEDGELPAGAYVVVAVSDTGCGMTEEVLDRVFEPFFTTREVGQGAGLGLSVVYGFTRQLGGNTTIESEPGKGTTVRMFLPVADACAIKRQEADCDV